MSSGEPLCKRFRAKDDDHHDLTKYHDDDLTQALQETKHHDDLTQGLEETNHHDDDPAHQGLEKVELTTEVDTFTVTLRAGGIVHYCDRHDTSKILKTVKIRKDMQISVAKKKKDTSTTETETTKETTTTTKTTETEESQR